MRKFNSVYCLFEQTNTFRNEFRKAGFPAFSVDCSNKFGTPDFLTDIFKEIDFYFDGKPSIFDKFSEETLLFAFFPCTYFSDQSSLKSRGDTKQDKEKSLQVKLIQSENQMTQRALFYSYLCKLCRIALEKNAQLIIENPHSRGGFLRQFFPIRNIVQINNRALYGDNFKKPTNFFFVNCEPSFNLLCAFEPEGKQTRIEDLSGFQRSIIKPAFAENFIKNFIL